MKKFAQKICDYKIVILVISLVLFVLSLVGIKLTKINYDILVYLPEDIETVKGQNILTNDFGMGAYSVIITENMSSKDLIKLEKEYKKIEGVNKVISAYDVIGTTVPIEMLPNEIVEKFHQDNTDLLFVTFKDSTSSTSTINAIEKIKDISSDKVKVSGMSAMVLDTMNLSEKEIAIYIVIAVILCLIVLELSLDSYIVPLLLLGNIGMAIMFNLGSNILFGEISYITKALVAVLQLGVTTDFSIFLYHSYENKKTSSANKEEAMKEAIVETFISVMGSSLTTIAGFLVLCTMNLTLGKDLGLVMAKGVFLGVISVITLFPSLLLVFDNLITKTKHKPVTFHFKKLNEFVIKHHKVIFILFLLLLIPTYLANSKVDVYYKIDQSLPDTLDSIVANTELKEKFNIVSPEIILVDKNMKADKQEEMINRIKEIDGIDFVLSFSELEKLGLTENMLPSEVTKIFESNNYQMLLINSTYDIATNELNNQVLEVNKIIKEYDSKGILAGEGPLMRDLVTISDEDFNNVNYSSIICILLIMLVVLKSISLPILLILSIEFAIFTNMSISYFSGVVLPFVAPIVLGTIQLGATIDYAILMTTNYLRMRKEGIEKKQAMLQTTNYCSNSIFVSGMCFFAATFGVGVYSDLEMVGSLCTLISRGAIISMLVVITVLPSILLIFDSLILKTTYGMKGKINMKNKKNLSKKIIATGLILSLACTPLSTFALSKEETVYTKLDSYGSVKSITVNNHLINDENLNSIEDYSELENILNINNDNKFTKTNNKLIWDSKGSDIFYQGTTKKTLPLSLNISYKLDGKEMKLEDMLGKSGKVTITLKYQNKDKHGSLYTPFVVTMSTLIDGENNSDVTVTNGKVVNNGTKNVVIAIATPGLYDSLKIKELENTDTITLSYKTKSFSLSSIYQVVTPKLIDSSDLDVFNKLNLLYNSVDTLQSSMNSINDGANTLKGGSNELKTKLMSNIDLLSKDNSDALSDDDLKNIDEKTKLTISKRFDQNHKNAIMQSAWDQTKTDLAKSDDKTIEKYVISSVEEAVNASVKSAITSYLTSHPEKINDYQICENAKAQKNLTEEAEKSCKNISDIDLIIKTATEAATASATNTAKLTTNYIAESVSKKVAVTVAEQTAYEVGREVAKETSVEVANEVKKVSTEKVKSSLTTLYNGIDSLDNGINLLSESLNKFNKEGINKISSLTNNEAKPLTNRVKELSRLSNNYSSFAEKSNSTKGNTKFILVIDSVNAKKEEVVKQNVSKKVTFIDRIKNLFK